MGIILYIFFGLLLGVLTRFALQSLPIPYTAWLMIWGLIIGIVQSEGVNPEHMKEGIDIITRMPPELFLLIFLPPVIFASGISMDWHILKRNIGQVLLLATVGVVIGAALIASIAKYLFDYDWKWDEALTFGSMMAATDPVAVVALLKEVGASKRLGVVIEGESLFNDGTAQVFFLLFKEMVIGKERSFGSAVGFFCQLSLGGPAIGLGMGILIYWFLTFVYNDFAVEISITVCGAYLCYFLSEEVASASGILAVVALGIFMAALGKFAITPKVKEPLDSFWEMSEFVFNTVLFIYAGTVIAEELHDIQGERIELKDWGYAFLLYILLQFVRGITIILLYPLLSRMGYGLTWKDALIMTWGGLRGAVGLALALQIYLEPEIENVNYKTQVLFHMGVIAVLTLLINGTTTPFLLSFLGVTATSPEKLETLVHIVLEMEDYADTRLDHLRHDALIGDPDWELVLKASRIGIHSVLPDKQQIRLALLDNPQPVTSRLRRLSEIANSESDPTCLSRFLDRIGIKNKHRNKRLLESMKRFAQSMRRLPSQKDLLEVTPTILLTGGRKRYIMAVKSTYAEGYEKGYIGVEEVTDLLESCDRTLDNIEEQMQDWKIVESFTQVNFAMRTIFTVLAKLGLSSLTKMLLYWDLRRAATLSGAFVFAHREAQKILDEYIQFEMNRDDVDRALQEVKMQQYEKLCIESNQQIELAIKYIKQLKLAYPEVMRAIKSRQVAQTILRHKDKFIQEVFESGAIEEKEAHQLEALVERKMKKLLYSPPVVKVPAPVELLRSHFLFNELPDDQFHNDIETKAELQVIDEGKTVFQAGDGADYLYIVVQGVVRVEHVDHPNVRTESVGAMVGITAIVQKTVRKRSMFAETPLVVFRISAEDFRHMMGQYHTIFLRAWQTVGAAIAMLQGYQQHRLMHYSELLDMYRKARLMILEPQDKITVITDSLLVEGKVKNVYGETFIAPIMLDSAAQEYQSLEHTLVLVLPEDASAHTSFDRKSSTIQDVVLRRNSAPRIKRVSTSPSYDLVQRWQNLKVGTAYDIREGDIYSTPFRTRRDSQGGQALLARYSASAADNRSNEQKRAASGPLPVIRSSSVDDDKKLLNLHQLGSQGLPKIKEMGSFRVEQSDSKK